MLSYSPALVDLGPQEMESTNGGVEPITTALVLTLAVGAFGGAAVFGYNAVKDYWDRRCADN